MTFVVADLKKSGNFQQQVILVDSPNKFYDTKKEYGAFHIYAFMCPLTRYTADRQHFLEEVINVFGNSFFDRCILIFTHCSKEQEERILEEIKAVSKMDKNIRNLFPEKNYLLCPNDSHNITSCAQFKNKFAKRVIEIAAHTLKPLSIKPSGKKKYQRTCDYDEDYDINREKTTVPKSNNQHPKQRSSVRQMFDNVKSRWKQNEKNKTKTNQNKINDGEIETSPKL